MPPCRHVEPATRAGRWPANVARRVLAADKYVGLAFMIATTVAFATMAGGGFDASSRARFVALAGLCLVVAGAIDAKAVVRAARSPLSFTLTALALVSICSAA